jgi:arginyl-tRNA--protein-N-Asp/Glu arginylyltransferase
MQENNSAGKSIESYCSKCKQNLDHTIMSMDGDAVSKVRCKTCGSMHKFRGLVDAQKIRKARAKTAAREAETALLTWEAHLAEAKGKERDYDMAAKYRVGDIVNHHSFGKGIVMELFTNKCEMMFKDRERLMASIN